MGISKLGITLAEQCTKYTKACGKSSILQTKSIQTSSNIKGLTFASKLTGDILQCSKPTETLIKEHQLSPRVLRNIERMNKAKENGQRTITYFSNTDKEGLLPFGIKSYNDLINSSFINNDDINIIKKIYNNAKRQKMQHVFDENIDLLVNFTASAKKVNGKIECMYDKLSKGQLEAISYARKQFQQGKISEDVFGAVLSRISTSIPHELFQLSLKNKKDFIERGIKITGETSENLERYFEEIHTLKNILSKQHLPKPITVHRVENYGALNSVKIGDKSLGDLMQQATTPEKIKEIETLLNSKNIEVQYKNFIGTSMTDLSYIGIDNSKYPLKYNILLEEGANAAVLPALVPPMFTRFDELEVLLQTGTKLKVQNAVYKNGYWNIDFIAK